MSKIDHLMDEFRAGHHEFENGHLDGFEGSNPFELFEHWMNEAVQNGELEANAFNISTVSLEGYPESRIVYLKELQDREFIFYTNYNSSKGKAIEQNDKVTMLFFWPKSSRQVRVNGICSKVAPEVSDDYFASRPRGSQIGAWASHQSEELLDREVLEDRIKELELKFPDKVDRPPHWGGYKVKPISIEFWQGRPSRLHDRILFKKNDVTWDIVRLNP